MTRVGILFLFPNIFPFTPCSLTLCKLGLNNAIDPGVGPVGDKAPRFKVPLEAVDVIEKGRPELGGWFREGAGEGQVRLEAGEEWVSRAGERPLVMLMVGVVGKGVCVLGRFIFVFVLASTGKGEETSRVVSGLVSLLLSENSSAGKIGGGSGAVLLGSLGDFGSRSLVSRRACMLEKRRGSWKSTCASSGELSGMRLDSQFGCGGALSFVGEGVSGYGDLGGMSITVGLHCWRISKVEFLCFTITGVRFGGCLGEMESLTGESGRVTLSAVGGGFRVPLRIESRGLLGRVVVVMAGSGGVSTAVLLTVENRLLDEFGTLKLGVPGE